MNQNERKEVRIFNAALELPAAERAAWLDQACAGDAVLRRKVEALLQACGEAEDFFKTALDPQPRPPGPPTVVVTLTEKPGERIGRYKLLQQIGEGGCGVVFMAEQEEPVRRRVALKVIRLGMDTKTVVARFEAERQALALMDHPNIAKVFDGGATESGRPYFVMELVRGIKITEYCDQAQLSTGERLKLFIQVCQAVQHAHQKGVIHRDIKPSNILVTVNDGVAVPKVIDFGIAKATDQRLTDKTYFTEFHAFIGTPAYTSPEQAEMSSLDIDTRSDIYSLGVLLYEMLTGQTPFPAERLLQSGLDEMRRIIREEEPPKPSTRLTQERLATRSASAAKSQIPNLKSDIDQDLDWIVMKALEKDRTRRYANSLDFAADIQRHLNNEPVLAGAPSNLYKLQKLIRRNQGAFAAAAAVFLALLTGLGLTAWQAVRATRAEKEARNAAMAAETQQARAETEAGKARTAQKQSEQQRAQTERNAYVISMNLLPQAWEQHNVARVRELLEETATYPGRGFEWYYWQRQTHLELMTLRGHSDRVRSVGYSPDGRRILTGSYDRTAKVWDATNGKELLTLQGHTNEISSVAYSPDGQRLLTGSHDDTAKMWDAASGKELLTLRGHSYGINSVTFSPDGRRLLTGSSDHTAKVWDAVSGKELLTLRGHSHGINSVAFSPDGQRILTGSDDSTAKVWDAVSGKGLLTLQSHAYGIESVAYSPDGQHILTSSDDSTAKVWDAASGRELLTLRGHAERIESVAYSPDSQRILTGSYDRTAKVWDAASGKELITLRGHADGIYSVAFSPDGHRILTGSYDRTAKVWDAANGSELPTFQSDSSSISSLSFSPDGQRFLGGSSDHTAKAWDVASGKELLALQGHTGWIRSVAYSSNGQRILTGSDDSTAKVWDAASGKELLTLRGHTNGIINPAK